MLLLIFSVIALILAAFYVFQKRTYRYWPDRGVQQGKPVFIFGDIIGTTIGTKSFAEINEMVYNYGAPDSRYAGMYQLSLPTLVLRDPELIKQITVKDFDHFVDHRNFIPEDSDPLWNGNLFSLLGQKWREMRSNLSPAFTSSKMKYMFNMISDSAKQFSQHFLKQDQNIIELEMRDAITRFANDVIANTAFGIQCDSLEERDNEFYLMGAEATDFSSVGLMIKFLTASFFPGLFNLLRLKLFSKQVSKFFIGVVQSNIASREKNGIIRPDLIHLLMEARKNGLKYEETSNTQDSGFATVQESDLGKVPTRKMEITDVDITSQALIFFFGGFDSVSSLMCWMSYELGVNPDVQAKLIEEIDETLSDCEGEVTYEAILGMKYMDMVVSETLRKWPTAISTDRVCTKPYTIEPKLPNEKPIHFNVGDVLWVPIFGIHRDPKYYPDPLRFDPERFNDENKNKIQPYTYLPFGVGPRNCIGSRFALLEIKLLFFHILSNFEIVPTGRTRIPAEITKKKFTLLAEGGFWFGLKKRVK